MVASGSVDAGEKLSRGASTSHGMFSRLHLTVECPTEFGQTVHVSGSSFLAGVSNPSLVSIVAVFTGPIVLVVCSRAKPTFQ